MSDVAASRLPSNSLVRGKLEKPDDHGRLPPPGRVRGFDRECMLRSDVRRVFGDQQRGSRSRGGRRSACTRARRPARPSPEAARCLRSGRASRRSPGARSAGGRARAPPAPARGRPRLSAIAQPTRSTESSGSGTSCRSASWNSPSGTLSRAHASISGEVSYAGYLVAERNQVRGVAAGIAGSVERDPDRRLWRISRTTGCSMSRRWFPGSS